ncbi:MAG: hypothetical protein ABEH65_04775 [Halobacteriales archaeon]
MSDQSEQTEDGISRRQLLWLGGGAAVLGGAGIGVASVFDDETNDGEVTPDGTDTPGDPDPTTTTEATADVPPLVEQYAPRLYFDANERWFPTDPRLFDPERNEENVIRGIDALNEYTERRRNGSMPDPSVFYHVVELSAELLAIQYWMYSVFDQFSVNFHWHDWELLQVFVDRSSEEAVMVAASAHARKIPNNEFLDPDLTSTRPAVLAELGSHSSATDLNGQRPTFQRFSTDGLTSDITNRLVEASNDQMFPFGYGLPRDEGFRLPYVVPELDGHPLYEHPDLEAVSETDLITGSLVVRTLTELTAPPTDLPKRESGRLFTPTAPTADDAVQYRLKPIGKLQDEIDGFDGPQLSFEFAIPGFIEDQFADHLTTTDTPWTQERFEEPLADITDPDHRAALIDRYDLPADPSPGNILIGAVRQVIEGADGTLDATSQTVSDELEEYIDISFEKPSLEIAALLESEPTALPSTNGLVMATDIEPADHRLTVNGAGYAPYTEQVTVGETEMTRAGAEGSIGLVANEAAVKLRGDASEQPAGLDRVRIDDDFAGQLYDSAPLEGDRFALYAHQAGTYNVEITDTESVKGAFRVDPGGNDDQRTLPPLETGKASLSSFLESYLADAGVLAEQVSGDKAEGAGRPTIAELFARAAGTASEAAAAAGQRRPDAADNRLRGLRQRLAALANRIENQRDNALTEGAAIELENRRSRADQTTTEALDSPVR